MKNAIGSEMLARWRFFAFGDVLSAYEFAFGRRGFASAMLLPAQGAVSSSSMPFALIVSGRHSIHTAIISTDA